MIRGGARTVRGKHTARARFGNGERVELVVPWAKTPEEARERALIIAEVGEILANAGRRDLVKGFAKELVLTPSMAHVDKVRRAVSAIVRGATKIGAGRDITFKQWGERYTSGELSRLHPDHVRAKDWRDDASRLRLYVYPHVGSIPVHAFSVAHGDLVMAKLPPMAPSNRRHVAQIMRRLLELAVYPGKIIPANPLPKYWMPKLPKERRHYTFLYPREELALLRHEATPIAFRLLVGTLTREGMRVSEALESEWWQWNLVEGTFTLTKTKTLDPRMWALSPSVARAMTRWKKDNPDGAGPFDAVAKWCPEPSDLAQRLRDALRAAGVTRSELFESTDHTGKLRVHDMRATFVTMAVAEGRTEAWIRDRTGHRSTQMIDRYRRAARQVSELRLGSLEELDVALGWAAAAPGGQGGDRRPQNRGSRRKKDA